MLWEEPWRTQSLFRVAQWKLGPKLSSSGSAGTWFPTVNSEIWRQGTVRALRVGSVFGLTSWPSQSTMETENKPPVITSSSCTTDSTSVSSGNTEKAVLLWHWKPVCPLGAIVLSDRMQAGQCHLSWLLWSFLILHEISSRTVHGSYNLPGKLKPLTEATPPFYILIIAKNSWFCLWTHHYTEELEEQRDSWVSQNLRWARTECSHSPQDSRSSFHQ